MKTALGRYILVLGFGLGGCRGVAQYWQPVGLGNLGPTEIKCLYGDTVLDALLAGGTFAYIADENDTVLCVGMARWNGDGWDSIATRITTWGGGMGSSPTQWFFRYQGDLYATGGWAFQNADSTFSRDFARLDTTQQKWVGLGCEQPFISGVSQLVPKIPQDTLYATGSPDVFCGFPEGAVFQYDGSQFTPWPPWSQIPADPNNYVGYVWRFQGYNYMSGTFLDPLGASWSSFMRHDGTNWEYVPGWGVQQGPIKDILIRNDTMYLCGAFKKSQGAPGNLVAAFTGTSWVDLGDGLAHVNPIAAVALDMEWWNDELFVCGVFDSAAHVVADNIAKWDGSRWCSLPGDLGGDNILRAMTVWRDTLYICGGFNTADGLPAFNVAQWAGGDATLECGASVKVNELAYPSFSLYPNPASTVLTITAAAPAAAVVLLTDPLGRVVLQQAVRGTTSLNVQTLAPGPYLAVLHDASGNRLGAVRWVKE